ncbi:hypothetical protein Tco_0206960 [Tanacetum coccineum]
MEEGRINGNELKTELKRIRTQIIKLQKKRLGQKDKIAFAHYRISDLEQIIEKIQARHQTNRRSLGLCQVSGLQQDRSPDQVLQKTTGPQESILRDKLAFVHFRISTLETTLEDIQVSSESSPI